MCTLLPGLGFSQALDIRASIQKGLVMGNQSGADQSTTVFLGSIGVALDSSVLSGVSLYVNYANESYHKRWLSAEKRYIEAFGIIPAVKLAKFILIGAGYAFGHQESSVWYSGYPDTTSSKGLYAKWFLFTALDGDIYVYHDIYLNLGVYLTRPINFLAVGISACF